MTKNTLTQLEEAVKFHSINKIDIAEKIYEKIKQTLKIEDEFGENMILDYMDINKI